MRALILAAGLGTRLSPLTDDLPKSLVQVNKKPILFKQIENLLENGISEITIISGYKAEILNREVRKLWPGISIVENVDYEITNNMYSAYLGMNSMFPEKSFEPFLMMNADVFFDSSVIAALLADEHENAVVVDLGNYIEESMKVTEKEGQLISISKAIAKENALGSSIDVYKFGLSGAKAFYQRCEEYIENKKELKFWSEVALNDAFSDANFYACPLSGRWFEIDNLADLKEAESIFI